MSNLYVSHYYVNSLFKIRIINSIIFGSYFLICLNEVILNLSSNLIKIKKTKTELLPYLFIFAQCDVDYREQLRSCIVSKIVIKIIYIYIHKFIYIYIQHACISTYT